ncbi:hypothetical protein HY604_03510 [Candidatus Peregrinibacteria bacterium]|nr:hypothetical protein [Candidatus Peregrinibacteria bacterium]
MENKFLIDLSIKYGLESAKVSKVVDIIYQCGIREVDSREGQRIANYLCEMEMVEKPSEEVMEELRLKGLIPGIMGK